MIRQLLYSSLQTSSSLINYFLVTAGYDTESNLKPCAIPIGGAPPVNTTYNELTVTSSSQVCPPSTPNTVWKQLAILYIWKSYDSTTFRDIIRPQETQNNFICNNLVNQWLLVTGVKTTKKNLL